MSYMTAGESHGKGLIGIIEGIPAGMNITEEYIEKDLLRRMQGHGRGGRMKIEKDHAEIFSGVRHAVTLGSPISLLIKNFDWVNWEDRMATGKPKKEHRKVSMPRPGHADLAGVMKYGLDDIRNVLERSSARETAMRVAIGAVCRKLLEEVGITVGSRVYQIHNIVDNTPVSNDMGLKELNDTVDASPVRCFDKDAEKKMMDVIDEARNNGDSVGGSFEVIAKGLPYGLGTYINADGKLQARISQAMMSVNAFKGVELGAGFASSAVFGSELHDEILYEDNKITRASNNAGGIEGGMSNAQPIHVKVSMKPISTLIKPLRSIDLNTMEPKLAHKERTDSCAVPAASIIGESMLTIVLADALLEKFGGDNLDQLKKHIKASGKY
ncbi:MAG: chorismate synthase [Candidatus Marinimicrobia bacterium]|nr:chorismate synthase [Candidatus Neomarinimicrobiota bacterium]MDG1268621.1 chorismate synthase [Candidatus Neomarinimicrobiota bacterium]MDG1900137.1 chorismate synthase [Candidatus Neomarinimicrobiota bacterium]MDG2188757.1 chorismate synthase [Candidatus Neomarinimicrobiota bacterium]